MDTTSTAGTKTKTRTRTRNRRRMNDMKQSADVSGVTCAGKADGRANRGRKKRSDSTKKIEGKEKHRVKDNEIITKPVIESTNPFFIAVCAPETYKSRILSSASEIGTGLRSGSGSGSGTGGKLGSDGIVDDRGRSSKSNVFLRHRNRNSIHNNHNNYPNRFIHHPLLQQSRDVEYVSVNTQNDTTKVAIELSNEELFPSLGKSSASASLSATATASAGSKLNFKEMVLRNAASVSEPTETKEYVSIAPPPTYARALPASQKSISSGNIFLAAFQKNDDHHDDYNNDYNNYNESESYISSSALIDSCDKKYDRLYSS